MTKFSVIILMLLGLVYILSSACNTDSHGFVLPQGDIEKGKEVFFELGCNYCHSAGDILWIGNSDDIRVELGGDVSRNKTYGELVTAVINPSHKISYKYRDGVMRDDETSGMKIYNEVMTVQNLVDIVTFLQEEYKINPPPAPYYVY